MEPHGKSPAKSVIAVIPARAASVRLPGKLLREIAGKPLIVHTFERAKAAKSVSRVIVATDDEAIRGAVIAAGGEAQMTSPEHSSGSDRVAEVAAGLPEGSIIVNVQGDEPLIAPETIDAAVEAILDTEESDIVSVYETFESASELFDPNNVKVVTDKTGHALYFSRSPMPWPRDASLKHGGDAIRAVESEPELLAHFKKHTGLYVYRREYLLEFSKMPQTPLEKFEMLEQLRALENGARIKLVKAAANSIGVDTEDDLEKVRRVLETQVSRSVIIN
ncbi:MAG: 3-deoxy-manno-octulosonate cytidylyltransferase [Acidobacteria bacterium]|nr:MAG: 3-deoxy-manno-octulosonate cytidylyltransferase [Acidobacteriota bacterium]